MRAIRLYIASSFRNLHAVRLFGRALNTSDFELLDWTAKAKPPEGLTPAERRMDADHGGEVFAFCEEACRNADIIVYLGSSGQDAGVEVGIARGCGVPVLGVRGPLEAPGLMLYGAGSIWVEHVEEALNLPGVQIHSDNTLGSGHAEKVGRDLRADRRARADLAILPGIAVIGNDCRNAPGAGAFQSVQHQTELHEIVVGRGAGGLNDKYVVPAHAGTDFDADFTVAEGFAQAGRKATPQMIANIKCKLGIGRACKNF